MMVIRKYALKPKINKMRKDANIMSRFKFTAGPWNCNEGVEAFGPGVRPSVDMEEKFKKFEDLQFGPNYRPTKK